MNTTDLPERGWVTRHGHVDLTGRPALFLDRDGTVIDNVPYLDDPARVSLLTGARETIAAFRSAGYAVIIVTNQSGVARGFVSPERYRAVEAAVLAALGPGLVDATYVCPFHPVHPWRKPEPGMLLAAAHDLGLRLADSTMVGDTLADVMAGARAGVAHVTHVLTGHGVPERAEVAAWVNVREDMNLPRLSFADSLGNLYLRDLG
ncbi:MAG: HAD-IIIA family hydrolase [Sphingomonas sp.]|uniref:D-glycero-alpha-D-manno-heptose-1,7-bisphosphate 7-phosphatase n=1 Tax=Sphingomonas sp. TaxID=28214 RepID=UPI0035621E55